MTRRPTRSIRATNRATLAEVIPSAAAMLPAPARLDRPPGGAEQARDRRQQHQSQHHRQILDDQPTDGDTPLLGLDEMPFLQGTQQHHRARDRKREPKNQARAELPAKSRPQPHPKCRGKDDLGESARHGDAANGQKILKGKVQTDTKHQKNDPDLGEVAGQCRIGNEPRCKRADQHTGEEVSRERRNT